MEGITVDNFENIEKELDVKIVHHLSIGDTITPYRTNLDGCGYIVATAETVLEAKTKAESALSFINSSIIRK